MIARDVLAISRWLDEKIPFEGRLLGWERIGKITEEAGEVIEKWLGAGGTNPRKGVTCTVEDVKKELLDLALTALGAWEHLDGNHGGCEAALAGHCAAVRVRAGL